MYRAQLQCVTKCLWKKAVVRGSASLPASLRQQDASRSVEYIVGPGLSDLRSAACRRVASTRSSFALLLATSLLIPLAATAPETIKTYCDDPEKDSQPNNDSNTSGNPLWPSGVSVDMVNAYVDEILDDPDINIKSVPDSIERTIYVSTVRLTLDTVYQVASWMHGTEVLGHRVVLNRNAGIPNESVRHYLQHDTGKINVKLLEAMADELLKNSAINQRWIPDVIERQIYANCLRIIFTIIDGIANTLAFHMCGHALSLSFEPVDSDTARELIRRHSSGMEIDEPALDALIEETVRQSHEASPAGIISYLPGYQTFIRTLHKTLYSLILGILDDILSKTELLILEDAIRFQLVPERVYASHFATEEEQTADAEKLKCMEKELGEVKSREARTRSTASVLVVGSMVASIAALLLSRRS